MEKEKEKEAEKEEEKKWEIEKLKETKIVPTNSLITSDKNEI